LGFVGPGSLSPKFGLGSLGLRLGFGDSGPCVSRPRLLGALIRSRAGPWSVRGRVLGPSGGGSFRGRLSGDSTGDPRLGDQHLVHPRWPRGRIRYLAVSGYAWGSGPCGSLGSEPYLLYFLSFWWGERLICCSFKSRFCDILFLISFFFEIYR